MRAIGIIMRKLQFSSNQEFNRYSHKVAANGKGVKLNPLQIGMAAADGYQSVKSYRKALDQYEADLKRFISEPVIFMTNGNLENTGNIEPEVLSHFGLSYQTDCDYGDGGFYPLTEDEEVFLADAPLDTPYPYNYSMGYTALHEGQKYLVIAFEVNFNANTKDQARKDYMELESVLNIAARHFKEALISFPKSVAVEFDDNTGHYACELLVPFNDAKEVASEWTEWNDYLVNLFTAIYAGLGEVDLITNDELKNAVEFAGKKDYQKGRCGSSAPFLSSSVDSDRWRSGWLEEKQRDALERLSAKILALPEKQQEEVGAILDDLVHDASERMSSKTNPYDPHSEEEEWENFHDEHSQSASDINNSGFTGQLAFLLQGNSLEVIEQAISEMDSI